jgi:Ca2+-transporting ATPase
MTAATAPVPASSTLPATLPDAHARPAAEVAAAFGVDPAVGLSSGLAGQRYVLSGPNELERVERPSLARIVWDSFTEPFILLLFVAGALAVALGEVRDGLFVLLMIGPMVGADVITQYRAERALEALRAATAPTARVRRDSAIQEIPAASLVPGDVVLLRVGDVAPADLRLVRTEGLAFDRSMLTPRTPRSRSATRSRSPARASSLGAGRGSSSRRGCAPRSGASRARWRVRTAGDLRCSESSTGWCASCWRSRWG